MSTAIVLAPCYLDSLPNELFDVVLTSLEDRDALMIRATNKHNKARIDTTFGTFFACNLYLRLSPRSLQNLTNLPAPFKPAIRELTLEGANFWLKDGPEFNNMLECLRLPNHGRLEELVKERDLDLGLSSLGHVNTLTLDTFIGEDRLVRALVYESQSRVSADGLELKCASLSKQMASVNRIGRVRQFLWSMCRTGFTCETLHLCRVTPMSLKLSTASPPVFPASQVAALRTALRKTKQIRLGLAWNAWEYLNASDFDAVTATQRRESRPKIVSTFLNCAQNLKELKLVIGKVRLAPESYSAVARSGIQEVHDDFLSMAGEIDSLFDQLHCPNLNVLKLTTGTGLKILLPLSGLCHLLGEHTALEVLSLQDVELDLVDFAPVYDVLKDLTRLRELRLEGIWGSDDRLLLMVYALDRNGVKVPVEKSWRIHLHGVETISEMLKRHGEFFVLEQF